MAKTCPRDRSAITVPLRPIRSVTVTKGRILISVTSAVRGTFSPRVGGGYNGPSTAPVKRSHGRKRLRQSLLTAGLCYARSMIAVGKLYFGC